MNATERRTVMTAILTELLCGMKYIFKLHKLYWLFCELLINAVYLIKLSWGASRQNFLTTLTAQWENCVWTSPHDILYNILPYASLQYFPPPPCDFSETCVSTIYLSKTQYFSAH